MCSSISLTKRLDQLEFYFEARMKIPFLYEPWYYIETNDYPNLFCIPQEDPKQIFPMEWGLIPPSKETSIETFRRKHSTFYAKAETALTSEFYKQPVRQRRCLILADGFFLTNSLPEREPGTHYYYLKGNRLFAIAGFYNTYDKEYWSASMITLPANQFISKSENHPKEQRMPLVLDPEFEKEWINPHLKEGEIEELIATGYMRETLRAHSVSSNLGNTPKAIEPV